MFLLGFCGARSCETLVMGQVEVSGQASYSGKVKDLPVAAESSKPEDCETEHLEWSL